MTPLLSIGIPTFNHAQGLRTLLESMLPLPDDVEVVISDNGSTDNTGEVMRDFQEHNAGCMVTTHVWERNMGFLKNVSCLPTLSTGEYVWMMSDNGNILSLENLKAVIEYIRKHRPDFMMVNALLSGRNFVEPCSNIGALTVINQEDCPFYIRRTSSVLCWMRERQVFNNFDEVVDRWLCYSQWLPATIMKRGFSEGVMREARDAGLHEPQIFAWMLAASKFPLHYLGDVYVRSTRRIQGRCAYYEKNRDALPGKAALDFIDVFFERPDSVLQYLHDKHGLSVRLRPGGIFAREKAKRYVRCYASARAKGIMPMIKYMQKNLSDSNGIIFCIASSVSPPTSCWPSCDLY